MSQDPKQQIFSNRKNYTRCNRKPQSPRETQEFTEEVILELPLEGAIGICQADIILDISRDNEVL